MTLIIRNIPEEVVVTLDEQARCQNVSREEFVREALEMVSLNSYERNQLYFWRKQADEIRILIDKNIRLLEVLEQLMEG